VPFQASRLEVLRQLKWLRGRIVYCCFAFWACLFPASLRHSQKTNARTPETAQSYGISAPGEMPAVLWQRTCHRRYGFFFWISGYHVRSSSFTTGEGGGPGDERLGSLQRQACEARAEFRLRRSVLAQVKTLGVAPRGVAERSDHNTGGSNR
jgi:hypothetical protein